MDRVPGDFDEEAFWDVLDERRGERELTWGQLNREIGWVSAPALTRMRESRSSTCQFILPFVQWTGRAPEAFTFAAENQAGELLPDPGEGPWRWYWDMHDLQEVVRGRKADLEMTWAEVAAELASSTEEVQFLFKTRYGVSMSFAMRAARWVGRSATSFMWENDGRGLPWSPRRL